MQKDSAQKLIQETLQSSFNKERFIYLAKNVLNHIEEAPFIYKGNLVFDDFADSIQSVERIGKYQDPEEKLIDVLIVRLKKEASLDRARTKQRNFIAKYLKGSRGGVLKDAALVAFVSPNEDDWRFSLVKMEYKFNDKGKVEEEFTPARRYSFLVGKHENSHTAQSRLLPLLLNDEVNPTLKELEDVFSVEKVTKEFFEKYRELFLKLKEALDEIVKKDKKVKGDFKEKDIDTVDFTKKLLGQIVFLYFLQKKGWFGVERNKEWGSGSKRFLRELFEKKHGNYKNFFNEILEPLFYEALRLERTGDYYSRFDCRIPFLNGGLFDPLNDYDWVDTEIELPNEIFSNEIKDVKTGDVGTGILDVFDRYNFTVKEDEPLEKEVAVDPEMLGKVFENLLEVKDRKSKGTYYTPREIVHYMCQESLANYLATELEGKTSKEDIETLIKYGELVVEHDSRVVSEGRETKAYSFKLPQSVRKHAKVLDEKLASIRVCDPAVGSGAFPVGMMNEVIRTRNALTPYIGKDGERTPYNFKRHAIQSCLYGVDIDPGAVEIAKLRLWLSLIVDEEERKTIQPLPNLDYKIMQGNSLLGIEKEKMGMKNMFYEHQMKELEQIKQLHLNETSASKKQEYKDKIDELISQITNGHKDFDFEVYFSEVFHEKKGFDVVIANPPYISALEAKKIINPDIRSRYKNKFTSAQGAYDLYIIFFEQGLLILKQKGILTYISPSKFLSAHYASALRELILNYSLLELVDFSRIKVFESANVSTLVTFIKNSKENRPVRTIKLKSLFDFEYGHEIIENDRKYLTLLPDNLWGFLLSNNIELIRKIWEKSVRMSDIADVNASSTAGEADEFTNYISAKKEGGKFHKIINTRTIAKIYNTWGKIEYKNKRHLILKPYINLEKVGGRRQEMYKSPKLIFSKVSKSLTSSYDKRGEFASTNTNFVYNPKSSLLGFLAAYSNSHLADFIYKQLFAGLNMYASFQFQAPQLRVLPVPKQIKYQKNLELLVDKILELSEHNDFLGNSVRQAKVREYEKQIDQLVYKLYGLTSEEIKVVEKSKD